MISSAVEIRAGSAQPLSFTKRANRLYWYLSHFLQQTQRLPPPFFITLEPIFGGH